MTEDQKDDYYEPEADLMRCDEWSGTCTHKHKNGYCTSKNANKCKYSRKA